MQQTQNNKNNEKKHPCPKMENLQSGICVNIRHTDQWNTGESRNVLNIYDIHKGEKRTLTFYFTPNTNTNSKHIIMPTAKV